MKFNIYRTELPNLGKIHIFIADEGTTARAHWGTKVDTIDVPTAWDAAQIYLKKVGLKLPPNGVTTPETGVYAIEIDKKSLGTRIPFASSEALCYFSGSKNHISLPSILAYSSSLQVDGPMYPPGLSILTRSALSVDFIPIRGWEAKDANEDGSYVRHNQFR